jgi:hypothetical protein
MENKITLVKTSSGFQAVFTGEHALEIIRLFSTNSIPTPFTAQADPQMVLREMQANNPGVTVVLQ